MSEERRFPRRRVLRGAHNHLIGSLIELVNKGQINLSPPYQRGDVWTPRQREELIDTLDWGLAIPPLYLRELDNHSKVWMEVLDGKQRLTTLVMFAAGQITYQVRYFQDFTALEQDMFRTCLTGVNTVGDISDEEARILYDRINFNGTPQIRPEPAR